MTRRLWSLAMALGAVACGGPAYQPAEPPASSLPDVSTAAMRGHPLAQTAGVLNLDVTNVRGRTRDISALGADRSTAGAVFTAAARAESLVVAGEPDVRGAFFRSDHFPFARAGVPALSIRPGLDFVGRSRDWGREQEALYNSQRYHQPSDEYVESFDFEGMAQQVRVALRVALAVAEAPETPRWHATSEFQRPTR